MSNRLKQPIINAIKQLGVNKAQYRQEIRRLVVKSTGIVTQRDVDDKTPAGRNFRQEFSRTLSSLKNKDGILENPNPNSGYWKLV